MFDKESVRAKASAGGDGQGGRRNGSGVLRCWVCSRVWKVRVLHAGSVETKAASKWKEQERAAERTAGQAWGGVRRTGDRKVLGTSVGRRLLAKAGESGRGDGGKTRRRRPAPSQAACRLEGGLHTALCASRDVHQPVAVTHRTTVADRSQKGSSRRSARTSFMHPSLDFCFSLPSPSP